MKRFLNFFTILGIFFLVTSVIIRRYEAFQDDKYELATGVVTQVRVTSLDPGEYYYFCPTIEFTTPDERNISYYIPCTTGMSDYEKDQQVEIRYNLMDPGDAHINGVVIKREWFEPKYSTFLAGLGLFIILAGMVQVWWTKRKE